MNKAEANYKAKIKQLLKLQETIDMMLSNPKDKEKLKAAVKEMSDSMTRIDAERDLQKDIVDKIADEVGIEKKHVKKFATMYHKQNFNEVQTEFEEVSSLYEDMFG